MEDDLGWLQDLVDDPYLKIKSQKNIFWAFISFSSQPYNPDHVTSPIKSILIVEWLQWFLYSLAL